MNLREMEQNHQLSERLVHNLNTHPVKPFAERSFDACILAVWMQYLTRPLEVFADVARILKPDAPFAISFSNRMFATKAVALWRSISDADHAWLLQVYLCAAGGYQGLTFEDLSPAPSKSDPIYLVSARREMV